MTELHRIDRRLFLTDMGKRTVAVAILGSGVLAACSSDGEITVASTSTTTGADPSTGASGDADPTSTTAAGETTTTTPDANDEALRWERVSLGFVSAYVLARGSEVAIIDTGTAGSGADIERGLAALDAGWGDVNSIILTHLHGDHAGGLPEILEQAPTAVTYAGRADAERITTANVEALDDGDEIFGLQVIGTPGHTAGHISVLDPAAGLLVAGDAINEQNGMALGPNERFSEDIELANASVQRLAERSFETVVFGHGNPIETGGSDAIIALAQTLN